MSESNPIQPESNESYATLIARSENRRQELEPALASIMTRAVAVYHLLRPKVLPVGSAPPDHPLRSGYTVGINPLGGFGGPTSDSLYVRLGTDHDLSITQHLSGNKEFPLWKLSRSKFIDDARYEETVLKRWLPNSPYRKHAYDAEVKHWKYGYVEGDKNCGNTVDGFVSSYFDDWINLEQHLANLDPDLEAATVLLT